MTVTPPPPGRPSVQDVADLLRARTKNPQMDELGTFTSETRPTDADVERQIDRCMFLIGTRFGPLDNWTTEFQEAFAGVVAYRAALRIEKSYFPEQVRSDRSAYEQLEAEYQDELAALSEAIAAGAGVIDPGTGEPGSFGSSSIVVRSWTSLRTECLP